jgi:hypothetical protein
MLRRVDTGTAELKGTTFMNAELLRTRLQRLLIPIPVPHSKAVPACCHHALRKFQLARTTVPSAFQQQPTSIARVTITSHNLILHGP